MLCTDIGISPFTMQTLGVLTLGRKDTTCKQTGPIHPMQWDHIPYYCELLVSTLNQDRIMIKVQA